MPIEGSTVGSVARTRRLRGVSEGGVVLPPGLPFTKYVSTYLHGVPTGPPEEEHPFPIFVPTLKREELKERGSEHGTRTPPIKLGDEVAKMLDKRITDQNLFIQCPIAADHAVIPLVAELLNATNYTRVIPGGGGTEGAGDLGVRHRLAVPARIAPQLRIGWAADIPPLVNRDIDWWSKEGEPWTVEGAEGTYYPPVFVDIDPFDIRYEVPLLWQAASRPRDPLLVGHGNYAPKPGDYLYYLTEKLRAPIRAFEAGLSPAELAALRGGESEGEPLADEQAKNAQVLFNSLDALYRHWEDLWEVLEGLPHFFEIEKRTIAEQEVISDYQTKVAEAKAASNALPTYIEQSTNERAMRQAKGPFLNDVPNWAYRFNLKKPPGGLPDFTASSGFLVIQLTCDGFGGIRWPDTISPVGLNVDFLRPIDMLVVPAGGGAPPPTDAEPPGEWLAEMQVGNEAAGVPPQLGAILSGAVAH